MANANSTQAQVTTGFFSGSAMGPTASQYEKKSSSMASLGELDLLNLRGKRVQVIERPGYPLPDARFIARVMAVHLPAEGSGVETSLLLLQEGCGEDQMDYVDVSRLTLVDLL